MKQFNIFFLLAFFASSLLLVSCDSEESTVPFLTIGTTTVDVAATSVTRNISVQTNVDVWTAEVQGDAQSWIEAQRVGAELRLILSENDNSNPRTGTVRIVAGGLSETITVQQMGQAPAILVPSNAFTIRANGGNFILNVTSNIQYEIIIPSDIDWITLQEERSRGAMVTTEHPLNIALNSTVVEREAQIVVRYIGGTTPSQTVRFVQRGQVFDGSDIEDDIRVTVAHAVASSTQPGMPIEHSFDGDFGTIFHSSRNNTAADYWPITLDYFFEGQERIDYLVYHPRRDGTDGNIIETEIWAATQGSSTLVKIGTFNFYGSAAPTRVTFDEPLINPTQVRFVVRSGVGERQGFVAVAEMEFFRTNPYNFDPLTVFTDQTVTALRPGVTLESIEQIPNNLFRGIATSMYHGTYPREFRIGEFRAWPNPLDFQRENKLFFPLSLLDNPTGISVTQGEYLIVFMGEARHPISLRVINWYVPGADGWNHFSTYMLVPGINRLRMQNRGLVYVMYHTPDWATASPVKLHFATGTVSGYFDSQRHDPSEWATRLAAATDYTFDVIGKYAHLVFPTQAFRNYTRNDGPALIDAYDDIVRLQKYFTGLEKFNRPPINRLFFQGVRHNTFMFATNYRTGYHVNTASSILDLSRLTDTRSYITNTVWGPAHEVGHILQHRPGLMWHGMVEVTVNIKSQWVLQQWGVPSRINHDGTGRFNNTYEAAFHSAFVRRISHPSEPNVFLQLVPFWQLQLYFADVLGQRDMYKYVYERIRTTPDAPTSGESQLEFVRMVSEITQTNLIRFFRRWGFLTPHHISQHQISQSQINQVIAHIESQDFPYPVYVIEYIDDTNWTFFRDRLPVQPGTAQRNGHIITMTNWQNVVAYEVFAGDNLIFVSNRRSFRLDEPVPPNIRVYAVSFDGQRIPVTF